MGHSIPDAAESAADQAEKAAEAMRKDSQRSAEEAARIASEAAARHAGAVAAQAASDAAPKAAEEAAIKSAGETSQKLQQQAHETGMQVERQIAQENYRKDPPGAMVKIVGKGPDNQGEVVEFIEAVTRRMGDVRKESKEIHSAEDSHSSTNIY